MKRRFLLALIGAAIASLGFQASSGSDAVRTQPRYPLSYHTEILETDSPAPTPTPPVGILYNPIPESYPLVCRGGPSLETVIWDKTNIGFQVVRGPKPASQGLAPGECSWMDRGMNTGEPHRLSQYVEDMDSLKAGGTLAPGNRWYEELHSSDKFWTFMVYSKWRQLNVTSARPKG